MFDPEQFGEAMGLAIREAVAPLTRQIGELQAKIANMPTPKDGKDGVLGLRGEPGEKGIDGKDGQDGIPGKDGAPGADGKDGVDGVLGEKGADGSNGRDGVDGPPGIDGKDGAGGLRGEKGIDGKDGRDGAAGKDGRDGQKGADGLGLAGAMIDRDGVLQITMTNGEVKSLGSVVGRDGANGAHGTDGKDGASFEAFELEYVAESHEISIKATASGRTKELRYPAGGIRPAGYWREGTKAQVGEAWVHDGSLWIAIRSTAAKPMTGLDDWIIAARKGRDGERGQKGADATPIAPIPLKA